MARQPTSSGASYYHYQFRTSYARAGFPRAKRRPTGDGELIFDEFRDKELKPAYLADADPNRALLDCRVVCDLLGFDETVYEAVRRLAAKWCAEPSVHGGKQRPKTPRSSSSR